MIQFELALQLLYYWVTKYVNNSITISLVFYQPHGAPYYPLKFVSYLHVRQVRKSLKFVDVAPVWSPELNPNDEDENNLQIESIKLTESPLNNLAVLLQDQGQSQNWVLDVFDLSTKTKVARLTPSAFGIIHPVTRDPLQWLNKSLIVMGYKDNDKTIVLSSWDFANQQKSMIENLQLSSSNLFVQVKPFRVITFSQVSISQTTFNDGSSKKLDFYYSHTLSFYRFGWVVVLF